MMTDVPSLPQAPQSNSLVQAPSSTTTTSAAAAQFLMAKPKPAETFEEFVSQSEFFSFVLVVFVNSFVISIYDFFSLLFFSVQFSSAASSTQQISVFFFV